MEQQREKKKRLPENPKSIIGGDRILSAARRRFRPFVPLERCISQAVFADLAAKGEIMLAGAGGADDELIY